MKIDHVTSNYQLKIMLKHLPVEIIIKILRYLPARDIVTFGITFKHNSELYRDEYLWMKLIYRKYGATNKIHTQKSWYKNYKHITESFTSEQLMIIRKFKQLFPDKYNLLTAMHKYKEYLIPSIPSHLIM